MEQRKAEELAQEVMNLARHHGAVAEEYSRDLENALIQSDSALDVIYDVFEEALDQAEGEGSHYLSAPYEEVPRAMMNAVGSVYPHLGREDRERAVGKILEFLDGKNYAYVNGAAGPGYTTGIDDPLLLSDISIVRPFYWPGLEEGEQIVNQYSGGERLEQDENYEKLREDILDEKARVTGDVDSEFLVAYTLLRDDYSDFAQDFAQYLDSEFLNRTLRGITALRFGLFADNEAEGIQRIEDILPEILHEDVRGLKDDEFWIDPDRF